MIQRIYIYTRKHTNFIVIISVSFGLVSCASLFTGLNLSKISFFRHGQDAITDDDFGLLTELIFSRLNHAIVI